MERKLFLKYLGLFTASTTFVGNAFSMGICSVTDNEKCRKVWTELCGSFAKNKAFEYVTRQKGLPNILLYGDSISIGYTESVRNELEEKANVYRLHRNGQSSNEFIGYMEKMRKTMFQPYLEEGWDFQWDVIHFNVGLHDLKFTVGGKLDKVNGQQISSVQKYRDNLKLICNYLTTTYPKTKLIFATTTPVPEGEPGRIASDEGKYNDAALDVLSDFPDISINDLCSFVKPHFKEWAISPGNVHYNVTGKQEQGKEVARTLTKYL